MTSIKKTAKNTINVPTDSVAGQYQEAADVNSEMGEELKILFPTFTDEQMTGLCTWLQAQVKVQVTAYFNYLKANGDLAPTVTEAPKKSARKPRTKKVDDTQKKICTGKKGDGDACGNWCKPNQDFCHIKSHDPNNEVIGGCKRVLTRGTRVKAAKDAGLPAPTCDKKVVEGTEYCNKCSEMSEKVSSKPVKKTKVSPTKKGTKRGRSKKTAAVEESSEILRHEEFVDEDTDMDALMAEMGINTTPRVRDRESELFADDDYDDDE